MGKKGSTGKKRMRAWQITEYGPFQDVLEKASCPRPAAGPERTFVRVQAAAFQMDVIGLFWGNYRYHDPRRIRQTQTELYRLWDSGDIQPIIYRQFAFEALPEALAALAGRKSYGKVVLSGPHAAPQTHTKDNR